MTYPLDPWRDTDCDDDLEPDDESDLGYGEIDLTHDE